jgi:hypothetical protein
MYTGFYFQGCCYAYDQSNFSGNCRSDIVELFILDDVFVWAIYAALNGDTGSLMASADDVVKFGHLAQFDQAMATCL